MSAYGYDSERRQFARARRREMRRISKGPRARARQDAADAARRRRRHYEALIILLAAAVLIVGWDHERGPVRIDPTGAPATLPLHPEVSAR